MMRGIGKPAAPTPPPPVEIVIDLTEDLIEETVETEVAAALLRVPPPGAAPPAAPVPQKIAGERSERHRRPTPSSSVPAALAASMTNVHDEITNRMLGARERLRDEHDEETVEVTVEVSTVEVEVDLKDPRWIDFIAEPASAAPETPEAPGIRASSLRTALGRARPRCLRTLDLRGVFRADGAAVAANPMLPDEIFVRPARERARRWSSSRAPSRLAAGVPAPISSDGGGIGALFTMPAPAHRPPARRPPEETLPRGTIIDKYRIDRLLGKGGFAAVYRATHLLLNTQVAIKLLRPQVLERHPHLAKLLYEEARYAARIDHPNVVKVFDVTHSASITYIVMEHIDGRSLADTIARQGPLPWPRVVEIGAAVAAGLKVALHARLIHRDIKPANILLGKRGEIKIVDLGLVLRAGALDPDLGDAEPGGAGTGGGGAAGPGDGAAHGRPAAIGTYGYMAPEQALDPERIDFRADIYALGATLYEAAVGVPPFPIRDHARCLEMHAREAPTPPEQRRPDLPAALSALLLRMLAKKPDDRFPSYDALAEALAQVAAGAGNG